MKLTKKLVVFFIITGIGIIGTVFLIIKNSENKVQAEIQNNQQIKSNKIIDIIDGAKNPEMIPNDVAYLHLFDLIADRQTDAEKRRIKSYIKEIGLNESDTINLIASAEEFSQRVKAIDTQAASINIRTNVNPPPSLNQNQIIHLKQLEQERKLLVTEVAATLNARLTPNGLVRLRQHIDGRMKRKIKIFPPSK